MNREEYNKINNLLDLGKIDELRTYLDERLNTKEIAKVRKVLKELINSDYCIEYPTYYEKTILNKGITKIYKGFYIQRENSFIICHGNANIFELYDKRILTKDMKEMLENSNLIADTKRKDAIVSALPDIYKDFCKPVFFSDKSDKYVEVSTGTYEESVEVPRIYYEIAEKLLGDKVSKYIDKNAKGVYFESSNGKALVLGKKQNRVML